MWFLSVISSDSCMWCGGAALGWIWPWPWALLQAPGHLLTLCALVATVTGPRGHRLLADITPTCGFWQARDWEDREKCWFEQSAPSLLLTVLSSCALPSSPPCLDTPGSAPVPGWPKAPHPLLALGAPGRDPSRSGEMAAGGGRAGLREGSQGNQPPFPEPGGNSRDAAQPGSGRWTEAPPALPGGGPAGSSSRHWAGGAGASRCSPGVGSSPPCSWGSCSEAAGELRRSLPVAAAPCFPSDLPLPSWCPLKPLPPYLPLDPRFSRHLWARRVRSLGTAVPEPLLRPPETHCPGSTVGCRWI